MGYRQQYVAAVAVLVGLAVLGAVQATGGEALGLGPRAMAWLGVLTAGLGVVQSILPRVTKPPDSEREGLD